MGRFLNILLASILLAETQRLGAQELPPVRPGSLVVHLGATDGAIELRLAKLDTCLVHALTSEQKLLADLRSRFAKDNVANVVTVDAVKGWATLPYPDRFVHLLVADLDALAPGPTAEEIDRVLVVGGQAVLRRGGAWRTTRKAASDQIDDWAHKWYDATGNPVSKDKIAGPPTAVQWVHGPAFADRSVGGKAPRIVGGVFLSVDAVDGSLFARDAGTGLPLWRADLKLADTADFNVSGGKIYVHVDDDADGKARNRAEAGPLAVLDLMTGKRLHAFDQGIKNPSPRGPDKSSIAQTLIQGQHIVQAVGPELCVLDADSGQRRWLHTLKDGVYFAPIVLGDQVIVVECEAPVKRARIDNSNNARALVAFGIADGKQRWRSEKVLPPWVTEEVRGVKVTNRPSLSPIIGANGMVFLHGGSYQSRAPGAFLAGVSAMNGTELWRHAFVEKDWTNTVEASRVVARDGTVFYLGGKGIRAFDARTGEAKTDFLKRPRYAFNGYGECSGSRATSNWLIANGLCYWDKDLDLTETWAARSACGTGVFPANGMIFALPTGCDCISYSRGYLGLSSTPLPSPVADEVRLQTGPAKPKESKADGREEWPTFLGNPQRTGAVPHALPNKLEILWTNSATRLSEGSIARDRRHSEYWLGALSAPTVAEKMVVVACPQTAEVVGLDAVTGEKKWSFAAGGTIDSPPTLFRGLALFGCHDGWVYALRLADGQLAWRFLAAPIERKAMIHGHLSSAFPVHGSLLVLDNKLLVTAGFHNYLGGIHGWVVDPTSGKILAKSEMRGGPKMLRPVVNDILCASDDNLQGWLALDAGFGVDGQPRGRATKLGQAITEGKPPVIAIDRNAAFVRFPHDIRGGSTHGWSRPMSAGGARGHRVAFDKEIAYALIDPTPDANHPVRADKVSILTAVAGAAFKDRKELWQATAEQLGRKESFGALVKAGPLLYLGGGKRDGSAGFVQVVSANDGKLIQEIAIPARVTECGLAVANGRLVVSCEDGTVVCLGAR